MFKYYFYFIFSHNFKNRIDARTVVKYVNGMNKAKILRCFEGRGSLIIKILGALKNKILVRDYSGQN